MNQPQRSVLVVDDEETIRTVLKRILDREGYSVIEASNGQEALDQMGKTPAQFVISDIQMPVLDGLELLVQLKDKYPETKVLMITGYGTEYSPEMAISSGADYFITKPFRSTDIALTLRLMAAGLRPPAPDSVGA